MFGLWSKRDAMYGVIIDIGSGSVGIGVIESDQTKEIPEIIFSHRIYIRADAHRNDEAERLRQIRETLFSASLILSKEGLLALKEHNPRGRIDRILVTCSSPWSHTISRKVAYEDDSEFKVTRSMIRDLIRSAENEISEEIQEEAIAGAAGLRIVERATVNVRVNGYSVHDPVGLSGTSMDLSHITGLLPEEILEAVYEVREKIFTDTDISAHTYMLVAYCVLRDTFPKTDTLCIVDVTGESTEIGIVQEGILVETIHAPYGSNTLIREMQEEGGSPEDAISLIRAYSEQTLSESRHDQMERHLKNFDESMNSVFMELHKNKTIPQTLVITALPEMGQFFKMRIPMIIKEITKDSSTILEVGNVDVGQPGADMFIGISSRFFHKLHGCGELETK